MQNNIISEMITVYVSEVLTVQYAVHFYSIAVKELIPDQALRGDYLNPQTAGNLTSVLLGVNAVFCSFKGEQSTPSNHHNHLVTHSRVSDVIAYQP